MSFPRPPNTGAFLYVWDIIRITCRRRRTSPLRQACNRRSSKSGQVGRARGEATAEALYFLGEGGADGVDGADGVHGADERGERAKETRVKETRAKETREKAAGSAAPRRDRTAPRDCRWL